MKGFTLIETLVYIALLGLLMTGALLGSYNLVQSSSRTTTSTAAQDEGSFALRKLEWAVAGMTVQPSLGGSGCNGAISVTKTGAPAAIRFKRDAMTNSIQMCEDSGCAYVPITTDNVSVSCFAVSSLPSVGGGPSGVTATITLTPKVGVPNPKSYDFTLTRYIRM